MTLQDAAVRVRAKVLSADMRRMVDAILLACKAAEARGLGPNVFTEEDAIECYRRLTAAEATMGVAESRKAL